MFCKDDWVSGPGGSVQGACGPQERGEERGLCPSKEQAEQVEREDKYQHWLAMNNMKMIKDWLYADREQKYTG